MYPPVRFAALFMGLKEHDISNFRSKPISVMEVPRKESFEYKVGKNK
jgi:hypothetical protein